MVKVHVPIAEFQRGEPGYLYSFTVFVLNRGKKDKKWAEHIG